MPKRKIHPIIYSLVVNKYATLKEINEYYSIEEILDLYEMFMCNEYNKKDYLENRNG